MVRLAYGEAMIAEITTKNLMDSSRICCLKSAIRDIKVKALTVEEQHALVVVFQKTYMMCLNKRRELQE